MILMIIDFPAAWELYAHAGVHVDAVRILRFKQTGIADGFFESGSEIRLSAVNEFDFDRNVENRLLETMGIVRIVENADGVLLSCDNEFSFALHLVKQASDFLHVGGTEVVVVAETPELDFGFLATQKTDKRFGIGNSGDNEN